MRHSQISRKITKAALAFTALGILGACADSAVAPTQEVAFKAPPSFDRLVGTKQFYAGGYTGTIQVLGNHIISIPAGAICDPQISTYGPTEWDKSCTPLSRPILITATMMEDDKGAPYVDFQPALRFVPTKQVNLYLRTPKGQAAEFKINYCNNAGICMDESLTDASLETRRVGRSGLLVRRVKHFSGYMISSGKACLGSLTEELDGTLMCVTDDLLGDIGLGRKSGYMVASGLTKKIRGTGPDTTVTKKRYDH